MAAERQELSALLEAVEQSLKECGLWGGADKRPPSEAFLSQTPFFLDTMQLHEWLEYLLLPKLRELNDSGGDLPRGLLVHTLAEEYYRGRWQELRSLLRSLRRLDAFLA
ncbi:MAG: YqcC family protein [Succinivibrio sp.]|nr:YqcC family protein [Succinivibrio sp.]